MLACICAKKSGCCCQLKSPPDAANPSAILGVTKPGYSRRSCASRNASSAWCRAEYRTALGVTAGARRRGPSDGGGAEGSSPFGFADFRQTEQSQDVARELCFVYMPCSIPECRRDMKAVSGNTDTFQRCLRTPLHISRVQPNNRCLVRAVCCACEPTISRLAPQTVQPCLTNREGGVRSSTGSTDCKSALGQCCLSLSHLPMHGSQKAWPQGNRKGCTLLTGGASLAASSLGSFFGSKPTVPESSASVTEGGGDEVEAPSDGGWGRSLEVSEGALEQAGAKSLKQMGQHDEVYLPPLDNCTQTHVIPQSSIRSERETFTLTESVPRTAQRRCRCRPLRNVANVARWHAQYSSIVG